MRTLLQHLCLRRIKHVPSSSLRLPLRDRVAFGKRLRLLPDPNRCGRSRRIYLTRSHRVGNSSFNHKRGAAIADQSAGKLLWPRLSSEVAVPYATGEIPEVGDYVKNQWGQLGTVTRVRFAQNEEERICVRWDDGGLELLFSPASEYTLVSKRSV
jgi:hypothetical protein